MKIHVESERCTGHARCIEFGPHVYVLDDLGYNSTDIDHVAPELIEEARRGAAACPERAINIIDE